eukprot:CAMPEP_0172633608 /NCGR_PEP_ID=MMETSP1068-20121228/190289_1 /TAXON_ID=35684 /ORGANISM="Pseudopedinella elastica, Strain CCMP716" /LENGTH=99 /DNA_ID=CAMNT_0013445347 /DNA_START=117 /DNA_END=414 /DNA_ORIENTATION=-
MAPRGDARGAGCPPFSSPSERPGSALLFLEPPRGDPAEDNHVAREVETRLLCELRENRRSNFRPRAPAATAAADSLMYSVDLVDWPLKVGKGGGKGGGK